MAENEELAPPERGSLERVNRRPGSLIELGKDAPDSYSYIRTYWLIFLKRLWTIVTATVVLTTLAAIKSMRTQPVYEATARVEVEADTPQIQSFNDLFRDMSGWSDR